VPDISYYLERIPADAPPEIARQMAKDAKKKVEVDVFGVGFRKDKQGRPIEQGLGSPGNETAQSIAAYVKYHGPGGIMEETPEVYQATLKKKQADLAATLERKKALAMSSQEDDQ
jgi:hypothetical protein